MREAIVLNPNRKWPVRNPTISGITVLNTAIKDDSLKFFLNCLGLISRPIKKNSNNIPIFVKNENAEVTSLVKRFSLIMGMPRTTPARICPITLGRLKYLNISERKKARISAISITNKGFAIIHLLED